MVGQNYYNIPPPPDLNDNHQSWNHPIPDRHPQYPAHNPNPTMPHSRLNMPPSLPYPNVPIRSNPHPPSMTHPRSNPDRPSSSNFHPEYPTHNTHPNPPSYHPNNYYSEAGPSYLPPRGPHDFTENHFTENHFTEHHRVTLKRKNPELHIPPPPSYSSPVDSRNWSYPIEDSQRNVRSRPGHLNASSHLDVNNNNNNNNNSPAGNYGPNNATPQPFYSHGNVSALRGPERNNFSSYLPPPQAINITDPGSYNYDINHGHHHARNNTVQTMRSEPSYHPQNGNPNVPVPVTTHHSTISHSTFYENNNFAPRVEHHGARQSYVAGPTSARWRHVSTDFDASSSRSRPVMFSDVSSNSGRIRNSDPSFRASSFRVDRAPNRWLFEQFGSGEGPLMFDSSDFFDQHRDMRLDIDSMSYEELLALEERIGYVNAGLPDERISKCLKEFTYITCNEYESNEEQATCVICLESYEEGEEVGRLKCAHDFHTSCIKKWLQMKNACPVCKSAAFQDSS